MDTGKFALITEADFVLSRCGRFVPPVGSVVYIPKGFLLQAVLGATTGDTFYKEITGDTIWVWRSISVALSGNPPLVYIQVLRPDGRFAFNGLMNLIAIAGFGSTRYLLSREIECPPGSKIQMTLDDNYLASAVSQPVSMLCEGAYAYHLKDGRRSRESLASSMPRVFGGTNQNLLAPAWMAGQGCYRPEGYQDDVFTYGDGISNVASFTIGTTQTSAKATIQIDDTNEFDVRRFLFDVTWAPAVGNPAFAGSFLGRIRSGSGYALTDDYVSLAKYLGSTYLLKPWHLLAGEQIIFDLLLVDAVVAGTVTIECFADGVKRKVAA